MRFFNTTLVPTLLLLAAHPLPADEVTKWNELANQLALQSDLANRNPHFHGRMLGMAHAAVHDALNSIDRRYRCYSGCSPVTGDASAAAAAATAAFTVLRDQLSQMTAFGFPPQQTELSAAYAMSLAAIPAGPPKTLGIQVGQTAASQILSLRAADGIYLLPAIDMNYPQGTRPGEYRYTAPFNFASATKYGSVPPFVLESSRQFRPNAPYPINSRRYTEDYNEIKALGGDGVGTPSARTPDQTQIALFWLESSVTGWNRIARTASAEERLNLWQNARLFALLNLALTDGYIGSWEAKYDHNFWRPVTAIQQGNADGNDDTAGDPNWNPLAVTPPVPDHDSGHSVAGGVGAEVLELFFDRRHFRFRVCSTTLPAGSRCDDPAAVFRNYAGFEQAALENGLSRIYVGYHFRRAVTEGIEHGRRIGHRAFQKFLRPAH
jgi:hypothetical protein